ncbi:MAG: FkbM family methyltransferase [Pseudomonadota bacterium]
MRIGIGPTMRIDDPAIPSARGADLDECALVFRVLDAGAAPGTMIDVGAHHGSALSRFARAGWTVLAFEPDAANRSELMRRLAEKPRTCAKVRISPLAVSDSEQADVAFYASSVSTGISGLTAFHESHAESDRVATTTLDRALRHHGLASIDFLKIDVEGHELPVLRGLDIDAVRPRAIVAEFEDAKTEAQGYTTTDLAGFLVDRGYCVFVSEWHPIERYGIRHSWSRFRRWPAVLAGDAWGNLVAFAEPPDEQRLAAALSATLRFPSSRLGRLRGFLARLRRAIF